MTILLAAAMVPPLFLLWKVYQSDTIEKEPVGLLAKIFVLGMISVVPAAILETIGGAAIGMYLPEGRLANFFMYFIVVAGAEELVKYAAMKIPTWRNPDFNYVFDGVVYGVTASLGFATLENVFYVFEGGLGTAGLRALTSIPVHCICGIYMGHFYGIAKSADVFGEFVISRRMRRRAILVPMVLHGAYDFIISDSSELLMVGFFVFVIAMDVFAIRDLNKYSKSDFRMF